MCGCWYANVRVLSAGRMLLNDSKKGPPHVHYRRPYGCAALAMSDVLQTIAELKEEKDFVLKVYTWVSPACTDACWSVCVSVMGNCTVAVNLSWKCKANATLSPLVIEGIFRKLISSLDFVWKLAVAGDMGEVRMDFGSQYISVTVSFHSLAFFKYVS